MINRLREKVSPDDRRELLDDVRYAPAWIGDILRALATDASESNGTPQNDASDVPTEAEARPPLVVEDWSPVGAALHNAQEVDWQELTEGTASIINRPQVHVIIEGTKSEKRTPGRKKNLFAPTSSRVVHWLLLHSGREWTAREIGEATGVDSGHMSRILERLREKDLIECEGRTIRVPEPDTLLSAWREAYTPPCGNILKGVIPSKSGQQAMSALEKRLRAARRRYAFTGFGGAYLWGGQADFQLVTCYLEGKLSSQLKRKLHFVQCEEDAANVWVMEYADQVAFLGTERRLQTQVASPIFTHVDLAIHPEGAREGAAHLLEKIGNEEC
ncbi:winged helix DNA-binding protein [bacterium]|nr:winged helix DNA-binding protein [bacterium]